MFVSNGVRPINAEERKAWLSRSGNVGTPRVPIQAWAASAMLERADLITLGYQSVTRVDEKDNADVVQKIYIVQHEGNRPNNPHQDLEIFDLTEEIETPDGREETSLAHRKHEVISPIGILHKQDYLTFLSPELPMPFLDISDKKDGDVIRCVPAAKVYDVGLDDPRNDVLQAASTSFPSPEMLGTKEQNKNGTTRMGPDHEGVDARSIKRIEAMAYVEQWLTVGTRKYPKPFRTLNGNLSPIEEEDTEAFNAVKSRFGAS